MAPFFVGHDELYHKQSLGTIAQGAPALGAKMWCFFYSLISTRFSAFFSQGIALSAALHSSHIRR